MTPEENEALVEGLLNSRKLMRNIEQYRVYRSMGIRTVEQVTHPATLPVMYSTRIYSTLHYQTPCRISLIMYVG
jgi:hypothetical protein